MVKTFQALLQQRTNRRHRITKPPGRAAHVKTDIYPDPSLLLAIRVKDDGAEARVRCSLNALPDDELKGHLRADLRLPGKLIKQRPHAPCHATAITTI